MDLGIPPENGWLVLGKELINLRSGNFLNVLMQVTILSLVPMSTISSSTGMMPVLRLRIVNAEFDALLAACGSHLSNRVTLERRPVVDVEVIHFGVEHRESLMMLGSHHDVFHPGCLGDAHPLIGVELDRVELLGILRVIGNRNLEIMHDPLADAMSLLTLIGSSRYSIEPPMDKHSEAGLSKPLHAGVSMSWCFSGVRVLFGNSRGANGKGGTDKGEAQQ